MGENWAQRFGSEWEYVVRLGSAIMDPEEKKAFWESIKAKKEANPKYSIYSDFPVSESEKKRAMKRCMDHMAKYWGGAKSEDRT